MKKLKDQTEAIGKTVHAIIINEYDGIVIWFTDNTYIAYGLDVIDQFGTGDYSVAIDETKTVDLPTFISDYKEAYRHGFLRKDEYDQKHKEFLFRQSEQQKEAQRKLIENAKKLEEREYRQYLKLKKRFES